jgi:signal transduction histidine kinase
VLSNLVSNAVKYSPKNTTIQIDCKKQESNVVISVKDKGVGIAAEDRERIFERYYRAEAVEHKHISGFGIGLYLSAEIIRRHGGSIWVDSGPEKGSIFYFSLPL